MVLVFVKGMFVVGVVLVDALAEEGEGDKGCFGFGKECMGGK